VLSDNAVLPVQGLSYKGSLSPRGETSISVQCERGISSEPMNYFFNFKKFEKRIFIVLSNNHIDVQ